MSKYFKNLRQEWLSKREDEFNRKDLADAFGISIVQASHDIQEYLRNNPNSFVYNATKKMEELGIGRPSTYAAIISTLRRSDV